MRKWNKKFGACVCLIFAAAYSAKPHTFHYWIEFSLSNCIKGSEWSASRSSGEFPRRGCVPREESVCVLRVTALKAQPLQESVFDLAWDRVSEDTLAHTLLGDVIASGSLKECAHKQDDINCHASTCSIKKRPISSKAAREHREGRKFQHGSHVTQTQSFKWLAKKKRRRSSGEFHFNCLIYMWRWKMIK